MLTHANKTNTDVDVSVITGSVAAGGAADAMTVVSVVSVAAAGASGSSDSVFWLTVCVPKRVLKVLVCL